ncbi:MAG TPA: hypothetical protein VGN74_09945 [Brevundimonas sp.]|jgi:hypothetical protein|uniref:hypothetical protein n=1 Tax=Brevundimonas sp. TaxID=1871086 RepID=UPI002E100E42|nr:hypothetical protein [Brevundimonas sp.]
MKSLAPVVTLAAVLLTACGETAPAAPEAASIEAGPEAAAEAAPQAVAAAAGTPGLDLNAALSEDARGVDMLNGTWAETAADCAAGRGLAFEGSTFRDAGGTGEWQAEGDRIRIAYRPNAGAATEQVYRVLALSPAEVQLADAGGRTRTLQLCD